MKINVKALHGRDCNPVVSEHTNVEELKQLIMNELDIPVEHQRLMFKGKPLQDAMTLQQCGVTPDSKIFLSIKETTAADQSRSSSTHSASLDSKSSEPLRRRLLVVLRRHFQYADAERVADEFLKDLQEQLSRLSLDDIERLAKANLQQQFNKH